MVHVQWQREIMYQQQSNDANYNHFNAESDLNIIMHFTSQHSNYYMVTSVHGMRLNACNGRDAAYSLA